MKPNSKRWRKAERRWMMLKNGDVKSFSKARVIRELAAGILDPIILRSNSPGGQVETIVDMRLWI